MRLKTQQKSYLFLLFAMLFSFALASFFKHSNTFINYSKWNVQKFQRELNKKEEIAEQKLAQIALLVDNNVATSQYLDLEGNDISYYVFVENALVFWSENKYDVTKLQLKKLQKEQYINLKNTQFVAKCQRKNNTLLLALIKLKDNFDYENDYIKNGFAKNFRLNENYNITQEQSDGKTAIFSKSGTYLFSLYQQVDEQEGLSEYLTLLFWLIGVLLFFFAYLKSEWFFGQRIYHWRNFLIEFVVVLSFLLLCVKFDFPLAIFNLDLFSPIYYAPDGAIASLDYLVIITMLLLTSVYKFYFKVHIDLKENRKQHWQCMIGIQFFSALFYWAICAMISELLRNSLFNVTFLNLQDISYFSVVAFLLMGIWITIFVLFRNKTVGVLLRHFELKKVLIANFVVTLIVVVFILLFANDFEEILKLAIWYFFLCVVLDMVRYHNKKYFSYPALMFVVACFAMFVAWYSFEKDKEKRCWQYEKMSEKVFANKLSSNDVMIEKALVELDTRISNDKNILRYISLGELSGTRLTRYLSKYYFKKMGKNFEVRAVFCPKNKEADYRYYYSEIYKQGRLIEGSHFYDTYDLSAVYDYLGVFDFVCYEGSLVTLYIEVSINNKNNYSYPNRLFQSSENQLPFRVSAAKYIDSTLLTTYGTMKYPLKYSELRKGVPNDEVTFYKDGAYHSFFRKQDNSCVVISEQRFSNILVFSIYAVYLVSLFMMISLFVYALWRHINKIRFHSTMFNNLLRSLMIFFVFGITFLFSVVVYLYVNQSRNVNEKERKLRLEYVKSSLSNAFANERFLTESKVSANFILSDLVNVLETDIHLYNLDGELIATSRPIVFIEGFTSPLMNPKVYFQKNLEDDIKISESIGDLHYNVSYTSLRNKNGDLIGYISLPTFESLLVFKEELFGVLAIIVFIYLILILLSIFVCYLLAKGISRPMKFLEERLKTISFGKKNEKIDYQSEKMIEVAQLITQYNNMVDELAYSAEMLAKTEREQAWKQMARQIAHEIKNPLTPMKLTVQQLQRMKNNGSEMFDAYFEKTVAVLIEQIDNLSRISTEFSDFVKMPETELMKLDLVARLMSIVELFKNNYNHVVLNFNTAEKEIIILSDQTQITQIFNNLLHNAIQSIPNDREGVINISVSIDDDFVSVSVADNGCGVADDIKEHLFLPNFTTKSNGMGLGLTIVKNLVIMLGGEISFTSKLNEGTTFCVKFPLLKTE
jgi:signal transduction histidine kinase